MIILYTPATSTGLSLLLRSRSPVMSSLFATLSSCYPRARFACLRFLESNLCVRICCVVLMCECAFIALTGRGVISIIHSIVGVIFSIEGFWGAVKFDRSTTKRFLVFLVFFFVVSLALAVIHLQTMDSFCSTATDESDLANCQSIGSLYAYLLLACTLGIVPIVIAVTAVFYLKILSLAELDTNERKRVELRQIRSDPMSIINERRN